MHNTTIEDSVLNKAMWLVSAICISATATNNFSLTSIVLELVIFNPPGTLNLCPSAVTVFHDHLF